MAKSKPCTCGTCPACIRDTYTRQAKPYTDPAWAGRHPLNHTTPAPAVSKRGRKAA
jgi:hypothetical protein